MAWQFWRREKSEAELSLEELNADAARADVLASQLGRGDTITG